MPFSRDRVAAGQPFVPPRAELHNRLVDMASQFGRQGDDERTLNSPTQEITIFVENTTGEDIAPGAVVGFGDPTLQASSNEDAIEDTTIRHAAPSAGRWGVAKLGIQIGLASEVTLVGMAWAEVNVSSDSHEYADIFNGSLVSGDSGYAKIVWKPGTGTAWCLLQLGASASGGSGGCCCDILDLLQNSLTLGAAYNDSLTVGERIGQLQLQHGCRTTVPCLACSGGESPSPVLVTLTGIGLSSSAMPANVRQDFSDAVNATHSIVLGKLYEWPTPQGEGLASSPYGNARWDNYGGGFYCAGNVIKTWTYAEGTEFEVTHAVSVMLLRRSQGSSGEGGRWGINVHWRYWGAVEYNPILPLEILPPPAGALWEDDCSVAKFADHNDITPVYGETGLAYPFAVGGIPNYWSVAIDGSQAATPPPPPPE